MRKGKGNIPFVFTCDYEKAMQRLSEEIANPSRYHEEEWETPLYSAATDNHLEQLKYLIACGVDINEGHVLGMSPLYGAALHGYDRIVKYLLDKGAEVDAAYEKLSEYYSVTALEYAGVTPLMAAVINGYEKIVRYLVEAGANINATYYGHTVLTLAIVTKREGIVKYLIQGGALIETANLTSMTPLALAIEYKQINIIKYLIEAGISIDGISKSEYTPLIKAISGSVPHGDLKTVKWLIDAGEDIDKVEPKGFSPLTLASFLGAKNAVEYLVGKGTDVNGKDEAEGGHTPLHYAAWTGHMGIAKCLIEHGADIEAVSAGNTTPLIEAIKHNHTQLVAYLLEKGADPENKAKYASPLYYAVRTGNLNNVKCLVAHGANVDGSGDPLFTPLVAACFYRKESAIHFLVEQGADINKGCRFFKGSSALHIAVRTNRIDTVKYLIEHDANPEATNEEGDTPISIAMKRGYSDIVAYLETQLPALRQ